MSVTQQYRSTIQKLKKRIHALERQQEQSRKKLQRAMNEARKLAQSYQSKLSAKVRDMKGKTTLDQATAYARTALEVERNMLKVAEKKAKALASAVMEMDKQHIAELIKGLFSKVRSNGAAKAAAKRPAKKAARKAKKKK